MSYDLTCYKSLLGQPDLVEAEIVLALEDEDRGVLEKDPATKLAIVKALAKYNSRLRATDFQYGDITKLDVEIIEKEDKRFRHIELIPPEEDLAIQLDVFDNRVDLTVPYWYRGEEARKVMEQMIAYIRVIHETAGYFLYDPQSGKVFDPAAIDFNGLDAYLSVSENMESIMGTSSLEPAVKLESKPWWKFW